MNTEGSLSVHLMLPYITFKDNPEVVFTVSCEDSLVLENAHE